MDPILIYITTSNTEEAKTLSKILLEKKLIACSNILPNMTSFYKWNDTVESSNESVLILKTFKSKYSDIEALVLENHSYEIPCLISLSIEDVNKQYLEWMRSQIS